MYSTKQRKRINDYLENNSENSFSAKQLALALDGISISAVYRNLDALEKEGRVARCKQDGRQTYYRYIKNSACKKSLHLICKDCGKTFHTSGVTADFFVNTLAANDRFAVDLKDTVIYGLCKGCRA